MKSRKNNIYICAIFIVFFYHFSTICQGQQVTSSTSRAYSVIDKSNGLEVYAIESMLFDDQDWLWISGTSLDLVADVDIRRSPIIQRFNGTSFLTVDLPEFEDNIISNVGIKKGPGKNFFAIFSGTKSKLLYLINPKTLEFKEIEFPTTLVQNEISVFRFHDQFRVFVSDGAVTHLYALDNSLIPKRLPHDPITRGAIVHAPYFRAFREVGNHYIVNETRSGVYIYKKDGALLKKVTYETLGFDKDEFDFHLNIRTSLKKNDTLFVRFEKIDSLYRYDQELHTFKTTSSLSNITSINGAPEAILSDTLNNIIQMKFADNGTVINHYLINKEFRTPITLNKSIFPKVVSRNFEKELFVSQEGSLLYFNYETSKIKTFLNDKSIRAIHEINKEEFLVATENSGWYVINTNTFEIKSYPITLDGNPFIPTVNRFIYSDTANFWSADSRGIFKVDKKTKEVISYIYYPAACAVEKGNSIYYGTKSNSLFEFNKLTGKSKTLQALPNRDVQDIIKVDDTIYLACLEGLEVYNTKKTTFYLPSNVTEDNALLCIENTTSYGILIGSKTGKVYQFDPEKNTFSLFYADKLKASITSILVDDNDIIWLNTFKGIVSFNPENKMTKRFGVSDGLSFDETNRYSALKTSTGHFMVGTLKGLNYFHPDEMEKIVLEGQLNFSKISFYDAEINKNTAITAPQSLNTIQRISLNPEDRNLIVQYGLSGNFDSSDITYRYKLNDQPWADTGSELRLFNLAPGDYTLQIEALNSSQSNIGTPLLLAITAKDFFYNRFWFVLLVSLLLLSIAFWIYLEQRKRFLLKEKFSSQVIQAQERERVRIAKNLHDNVGQRLLLLKNSILLNKDNDIEKTAMITEAIKEVREMSHNLHPFQFEKLGLETSLKDMVATFQKNSTIFYSETIKDVANQIPKEKEIVVFRMLQECLTNVEKHSEATACKLTSENTSKFLKFQLKDNGKGFDIDESTTRYGLGMRTLLERARFIESDFKLSSSPGKGTTLHIIIPKK